MKHHFEAILMALGVGLEDVPDTITGKDIREVNYDKPDLPLGDMPPRMVRAIVTIDGQPYIVTVEKGSDNAR